MLASFAFLAVQFTMGEAFSTHWYTRWAGFGCFILCALMLPWCVGEVVAFVSHSKEKKEPSYYRPQYARKRAREFKN